MQELQTLISCPCLCLQTYIGTLLVTVNPYKELDIYSKKQMDTYMGVNFFELPPHMYDFLLFWIQLIPRMGFDMLQF